VPGETGSTWTTLSESSVVLVGTQNAISVSLTKSARSGDTSRLATSVFEHHRFIDHGLRSERDGIARGR